MRKVSRLCVFTTILFGPLMASPGFAAFGDGRSDAKYHLESRAAMQVVHSEVSVNSSVTVLHSMVGGGALKLDQWVGPRGVYKMVFMGPGNHDLSLAFNPNEYKEFAKAKKALLDNTPRLKMRGPRVLRVTTPTATYVISQMGFGQTHKTVITNNEGADQ